MRRARTLQAFAISSNVIGVIAAVILAAEALGAPRAVWAAIAAFLLVGLTSGAGLWYVGRRMRGEYLAAAKSAHASDHRDSPVKTTVMFSDLDLLRKEIVPAFQDAGLNRSHTFFLELVDSLNLAEENARREKAFVNKTVADPSLTDQRKIDRLVRHFAPIPVETDDEEE